MLCYYGFDPVKNSDMHKEPKVSNSVFKNCVQMKSEATLFNLIFLYWSRSAYALSPWTTTRRYHQLMVSWQHNIFTACDTNSLLQKYKIITFH